MQQDMFGRYPCPLGCGYGIKVIMVERDEQMIKYIRLDERDWDIHMRYSHQAQDSNQ